MDRQRNGTSLDLNFSVVICRLCRGSQVSRVNSLVRRLKNTLTGKIHPVRQEIPTERPPNTQLVVGFPLSE